MRIARLSRFVPPKVGGLEFHVLELTRHQALQGHEVTVFFGQGAPPPLDGVRWVGLGNAAGERLGSNFLGSLAFAQAVQRVLRGQRGRFDLVHAHGDIGEALAAWQAGRALHCPAVLTIHGELSRAPAYRLLARLLFRLPALVLVVNATIADNLRALGIQAGRLRVLSSGVNCAAVRQADGALEAGLRAELGLHAGSPIVIAVGRLHPVKGYEYLVAAAHLVLKTMPEARFIIVGEGSERPRLERARGGERRIVLAGGRARAEVYGLLRQATLFVISSVDLGLQAEGSPTSVLEAMAAGLPVVASRSGGLASLVQEGVSGYLVPERSPEALAERMLHLLGHPEEARRMSEANLKLALERDWGRQAKRITAACQELLA